MNNTKNLCMKHAI